MNKTGNEEFNELCLQIAKSELKIRQRVKVTTASWVLAGKLKSLVWKFLLNSMVCPGGIYAFFPEHLCAVFSSMSFSGSPCKNDGSKEAPHQGEATGLRVVENL